MGIVQEASTLVASLSALQLAGVFGALVVRQSENTVVPTIQWGTSLNGRNGIATVIIMI